MKSQVTIVFKTVSFIFLTIVHKAKHLQLIPQLDPYDQGSSDSNIKESMRISESTTKSFNCMKTGLLCLAATLQRPPDSLYSFFPG